MYRFEFMPGIVLLAAVVVLPLAPAFAMIALLLLAVAAVAALIVLAGAIIALPFLVVRFLRLRLVEHGVGAAGPGPVAHVIEHAGVAIHQAGFAAVAHAAGARGSQ